MADSRWPDELLEEVVKFTGEALPEEDQSKVDQLIPILPPVHGEITEGFVLDAITLISIAASTILEGISMSDLARLMPYAYIQREETDEGKQKMTAFFLHLKSQSEDYLKDHISRRSES